MHKYVSKLAAENHHTKYVNKSVPKHQTVRRSSSVAKQNSKYPRPSKIRRHCYFMFLQGYPYCYLDPSKWS